MEEWEKKYYANRVANQQQITPSIRKPSNTCKIRNNAMLYKPIETNGFGTTAVFVIPFGLIPEQYTMREFEFKTYQTTCYLLESQSSVIDTGKLDTQPNLKLIQISSPMLGNFFVSEHSIIKSPLQNYSGQNKILKG